MQYIRCLRFGHHQRQTSETNAAYRHLLWQGRGDSAVSAHPGIFGFDSGVQRLHGFSVACHRTADHRAGGGFFRYPVYDIPLWSCLFEPPGRQLYETFGNYDAIWIAGAVLGLIAAILHWPIQEQSHIKRLQQAAVH